MKTVCIYHSIDLDGWMSAAIVKYWFYKDAKKSSAESSIGFSLLHNEANKTKDDGKTEYLKFIGYNYGNPIPDLSEYDKIIMCDISFPIEEMIKISHKLIWIDHHISAIKDINDHGPYDINGLRNTKFAACELTWMYFFSSEKIPEIVRLLGRYDCFGHKETDEEQKVLEFQYGARQCISNYEEAYNYLNNSLNIHDIRDRENVVKIIHENGKSIYQYLCTEAEQAYKKGFAIRLIEEITDRIGKNIVSRKFICINKERFNPINFGIDYHKDGYDGCACYYFDGEFYNFSLYNDNGEVDCSIIAKEFGGGGHKGASGFRLSFKDNSIDSFLRPRMY